MNVDRAARPIAEATARRHDLRLVHAMKLPGDTSPTLAQLETALDYSCGALMALGVLRARRYSVASDIPDIELQVSRAIDSVRDAMAEVRRARKEETSALAFGFILARRRCAGLDDLAIS